MVTLLMTLMGYLVTAIFIGVWVYALIHPWRLRRYPWFFAILVIAPAAWVYLFAHVHDAPVPPRPDMSGVATSTEKSQE